MNITLNNIDPVNATIKIEIAHADYANEVEKTLNDLRRNAVIPGFRKGMVPKSRIQQMYGKSALVDEINKLVSKELSDYIRENNLNLLGEPLPAANEQKPLNFDNLDDYEFTFDIALAPQLDVQLTKDDKITYYTIQVTDEMIDRQIASYKANYGSYDQVETIEGKDMAKGLLIELNENGEPLEDGIRDDNAVLMPSYISNEEEKAKFTSAKLNDTVVFNPFKAYDGAEAELASFLKVKKEETGNYTGDFSFEIKEITRYTEAELNPELFDKVFEPGTVTTEEAFREKIKEIISAQFVPESDYKFILDVRKLLKAKLTDVQFPDAFLKRWLLASGTNKTPESIEEDYPKIIEDLKYYLSKSQLIERNGIKVEPEDVREYARQATRAQFAQYGMSNIPEPLLENYSMEMLKKEETVRNLIDKAAENKLIQVLKKQLTLEPQTVTLEEFQKVLENGNENENENENKNENEHE
jgi:trigger factor